MAKKIRFFCTRCEQRIDEGVPFCGACGYPTSWATHDDKVRWELDHYLNARDVPLEPQPVGAAAVSRPAERVARRTPASNGHQEVYSSRQARATFTAPREVHRPELPPVPDSSDEALMLKVLRLMNARIAHLEARIAELEGR